MPIRVDTRPPSRIVVLLSFALVIPERVQQKWKPVLRPNAL